MKSFWHKETGVLLSEPSMMELIRTAQYVESDFDEAVRFTPDIQLSDGFAIVPKRHRRRSDAQTGTSRRGR